jgi:membrane-bound ClpP family serine protease
VRVWRAELQPAASLHMITILLVIVALALLPAALKVVAAVSPGLLKVAFVVGCIIGLLCLASGVVDMVPDVVWIWAVTIVLVGGVVLLVVATVWDMVKRLRRRSR